MTLVEMAILLTVAVSVTVAGVNSYSSFVRHKEIYRAQSLVEEYRRALQIYHDYHCSDAILVQPTLPILINEGIIGDTIDTSISFAAPATFVLNRAPTPSTYSFSMVINVGESAVDLLSVLRADVAVGNILTWNGVVASGFDYEDQGLRRFRNFYSVVGDC